MTSMTSEDGFASARLRLEELSYIYPGASAPALRDLSLTVEPGELAAILGPSGCGKTTALKVIAGLLHPGRGDVLVDGRSILGLPPERRDAALVFQNPLLFPHMSVASNVGFGLRMRGLGRAETGRRVEEALGRVRMEGFSGRKPSELSGGQQQRVALARAVVTGPRLLLLDEPFSSLEANLRREMRDLIRTLQRETGCTTVFVTHDQEEAVELGDRVALLFDGELQMYEKPQAFYDRPASREIADFFGATNFLDGRVENGKVKTPLGRLRLAAAAPPGDVTLTIRPEAVRLEGGENSFPARITDVTFLGTRLTCGLDTDGVEFRVTLAPHTKINRGDKVTARLPSDSLWVVERK